MDNTDQTFDVMAPVKVEAMPVEIHRGPKTLRDSELKEYAKAAGLSMVRLKKIRQRNVAGELMQKLGAAKHGSWMLFESEEMITKVLDQIDKALDDFPGEPEVVASLLKAKALLIERWQKAAVAHIKSKKDVEEVSQEKPLTTPFPPASPVQNNLQLNVMVGEKKSE